jgi:putative OPT family oligopeptide transporter
LFLNTKEKVENMAVNTFKPFVPAETNLTELSVKSVLFGLVLAAILGAANAYIGLKAGMTISATYPAAVIAIAVLRGFKGTILEENILRTTATVGESLVAGAIFTLPAFLISGIWSEIDYWQSTVFMLVGGLLGVLFIIILRRTLVEEADLPYPESVACAEIVKAGQKGASGASYVFGAMGLASMIEFLKNSRGLQLVSENISGFFRLPESIIKIAGRESSYSSGLFLTSPSASPALMSVGYIIGFRLAAIVWAGGAFAWFFLIPLAVFINGRLDLSADVGVIFEDVWRGQVRLIAIGAMIVGAFHTLFGLRKSLTEGIRRAFKEQFGDRALGVAASGSNRLQKDIPFGFVLAGIVVLMIPIVVIYYSFTGSVATSLVVAFVMVPTGFLFAAVAAYLIGVMGSSNNPVSGLTLPALVLAAVLMVIFGQTGQGGIAATLGVAAVVCCALGTAGLNQDLKVGQILGGTPWKMEISNLLSVVTTSMVLVFPLVILHQGTPGGIGGPQLPAPQAGLMAALSQGIVSGKMAWPLLLFGAAFAVGLILIKSPSPTLIAVGMYLPFETTSAIFVGGLIKFAVDWVCSRSQLTKDRREKVENSGILLASGLVAGEAITGVVLAGLYLVNITLPKVSQDPILGLLIFPLVMWVLIKLPLVRTKDARG